MDEELVRKIRQDYTQAGLSDADQAMLAFVERMTTSAATMTEADVARLRQVGFDDRAILQITLIAAWFNYVNRVADALGVGK